MVQICQKEKEKGNFTPFITDIKAWRTHVCVWTMKIPWDWDVWHQIIINTINLPTVVVCP